MIGSGRDPHKRPKSYYVYTFEVNSRVTMKNPKFSLYSHTNYNQIETRPSYKRLTYEFTNYQHMVWESKSHDFFNEK